MAPSVESTKSRVYQSPKNNVLAIDLRPRVHQENDLSLRRSSVANYGSNQPRTALSTRIHKLKILQTTENMNIQKKKNNYTSISCVLFSRMRSEGFPFIVGDLGVGPVFASCVSSRRLSSFVVVSRHLLSFVVVVSP